MGVPLMVVQSCDIKLCDEAVQGQQSCCYNKQQDFSSTSLDNPRGRVEEEFNVSRSRTTAETVTHPRGPNICALVLALSHQ